MKKVLEGIEAYPLCWPPDWARSQRRDRARYEVSFAQARDEILRTLRIMGASEVVISSDVPTRRDGIPYSNYDEPRDPGIAVYWVHKGRPQVMACDHWLKVRENLRAVGLALEGLRSIERSGASQVFERAFTGFAALPASTARPWREVLELEAFNGRIPREYVDHSYRVLAKLRHPDVPGGSHEAMSELNAARDAAYKELGL